MHIKKWRKTESGSKVYKANKEASRRRSRKRDPEATKAKDKADREKYWDRQARNKRDWLDRHPEATKRYDKNRQEKDPEAYRLLCLRKCANRRARLAKAEGKFTSADIDRIFDEQNGLCPGPGCGVSIVGNYHIDHIEPLSRGGSNWPSNIALLCPSCNLEKWAFTWEEWLARKAA